MMESLQRERSQTTTANRIGLSTMQSLRCLVRLKCGEVCPASVAVRRPKATVEACGERTECKANKKDASRKPSGDSQKKGKGDRPSKDKRLRIIQAKQAELAAEAERLKDEADDSDSSDDDEQE